MNKGITVLLIIVLVVIAGEGAFLCFNLHEEFESLEYGHTTSEKLLIVSEEIETVFFRPKRRTCPLENG